MSQLGAALLAAGATASLMLLNRWLRRFNLSFEMKLWLVLAWGLVGLTALLVARALQG